MHDCPPPFTVGAWRVDPAAQRVSCGGRVESLAPKFMGVLVRLAETPGAVVTRDELLDAVWPDVVVGEEVLTRAVSVLRKTFGDDARRPVYIETIPTRGYRLVAAVGPTSPAPEATPSLRPPAPPPVPRRRRGRSMRVGLLGAVAVSCAVLLASLRSEPPRAGLGFDVIPVTTAVGEERDPALSPDGERVAYVHVGGGDEVSAASGAVVTPDLWVSDVATGRTSRLTNDDATEHRPQWSPDGASIAFVRCDGTEADLAILSVYGGQARSVRRLGAGACETPSQLAWSPDGERLIVVERTSHGEGQLVEIEVESGGRRTLQTSPGDVALPAVSPDGSEVAFVQSRRSVVVGPLDGRGWRLVADAPDLIDGLAWTRDAGLVATSGGRLWSVSADGALVALAPAAPEGASALAADRLGGRFAVERSAYDVNLWTTGTASTPRLLASSTGIDGDPRISPEGGRVAFVSDRTGACELWVGGRDGGEPVSVASLGSRCGEMNYPRWSPDGRHIAYAVRIDGQQDVFAVEVSNGEVVRLTRSPADEAFPTWSADGTQLYFASDRTGTWETYRRRLGGDEPEAERISTDGGLIAAESPDGAWLYTVRPGDPTVRVRPVAGGLDQPIANVVGDPADWRPAPDGLYVVDRSDPEAPSWVHVSRETGEQRHVATLPVRGCLRADIAPDGSWTVAARVDHAVQDIALLEARQPAS